MRSQLSKFKFTCCQCNGKFNETEGTWLPLEEQPIGIFESQQITDNLVVLNISVAYPPEIKTNDKFTCYNCTP